METRTQNSDKENETKQDMIKTNASLLNKLYCTLVKPQILYFLTLSLSLYFATLSLLGLLLPPCAH